MPPSPSTSPRPNGCRPPNASPISTNTTANSGNCGGACSPAVSPTAVSAPNSTSIWPTASCVTPSGWRSAGTSRAADRSLSKPSPSSTSPLCSTGSPCRAIPIRRKPMATAARRPYTPLREAYVVDAVRTPVGKRGGALAEVHPADLGAAALQGLLSRNPLDPANVDDVIVGCVDNVGPQAGNIGRTMWLAAGYPEEVPGVTVDRQCGSSQQAINFGAQAIMSGTAEVIVAGGVQNMSAIPISAAMLAGKEYGYDSPFVGAQGWDHRYGTGEVSQFHGAQLIAEKWGISREDMERWALRSHERARRAIKEGRFDREIVPVGDFW